MREHHSVFATVENISITAATALECDAITASIALLRFVPGGVPRDQRAFQRDHDQVERDAQQ
jgi:hypothetical protein